MTYRSNTSPRLAAWPMAHDAIVFCLPEQGKQRHPG